MRVGYDVEGFIYNGGAIVSATDFVPGSKDEPVHEDGVTMHPDNIMAEFSCTEPVEVDGLLDHLMLSAAKIGALCPASATLRFDASADVSSLSGHPALEELGCAPDMVYDTERALGMDDLADVRGAGFHLHFDTSLPPEVAVRVCDAIMGVGAIVYGERQADRRNSYGCAGAHRPKPYGIEYRTMSGAFVDVMRDHWPTVSKMIKLTASVLADPDANAEVIVAAMQNGDEVEAMINSEDAHKCADFFNEFILPSVEGVV